MSKLFIFWTGVFKLRLNIYIDEACEVCTISISTNTLGHSKCCDQCDHQYYKESAHCLLIRNIISKRQSKLLLNFQKMWLTSFWVWRPLVSTGFSLPIITFALYHYKVAKVFYCNANMCVQSSFVTPRVIKDYGTLVPSLYEL